MNRRLIAIMVVAPPSCMSEPRFPVIGGEVEQKRRPSRLVFAAHSSHLKRNPNSYYQKIISIPKEHMYM
jgi:hypothetical protein